MFSKDNGGAVGTNAERVISAAQQATIDSGAERAKLSKLYLGLKSADATQKAKYDQAALGAGYSAEGHSSAFGAFLGDESADAAKIKQVEANLASQGIKLP
jgi:hypothetical protein